LNINRKEDFSAFQDFNQKEEGMTDKKEFSHDSVQDTRSIGEYLRALIDGFDNGRIYLRTGDREMVLRPNNALQFSIRAKKKGYKSKISIKVAWKDVMESADADEDIQIS